MPLMQGDNTNARRHAWLLGDEHAMRLRVSQNLLASGLMVPYMGLVVWAGWQWPAALSALLPLWTAWMSAGLLAFFVALRSGWSLRFADPSLTPPQMVFCLAMAALSYLWLGPLRSLVPGAMLVILCFGMFRLQWGRALAMAGWAWVCLGLAALYRLHTDRSDPALDISTLLAALVMFPAVGVLAGRLSRIRVRLTEQREALNVALARIEELATRDQLTGLPNRRQGEAQLQRLLARYQRTGAPACVAMLDLDFFKRVNDAHGHGVGDAVLRAFSQAGLSSLRATDSLSRWGGEEFLLLLEDNDASAAAIAMQRLQFAVADAAVEVDGHTLGFTFSAGLTALREGDTALSVVERADQALYRAKANGRNQVVVD